MSDRTVQGVLGILDPRYKLRPMLRVSCAGGAEKMADFLVGSFHLAVGLELIARGEAGYHLRYLHCKPKYRNMRLNMSSAVSKAEVNLGSGVRLRDLENQSIIPGFWFSLERQVI